MSETRQGYTEIKTDFSSDATEDTTTEVSLDDVDAKEIPEMDMESAEIEAEAAPKEEEVIVKEEPKEDPVKKEKKKGRAKKRIQELVNQGKEKDDRNSQLTQENAQLRQQLTEGTKTSKVSQKDALEGQLEALNSKFVTAIQDGETEEIVSIQDKIMKTQMALAGLTSELTTIEKEAEVKEKTPTPAPQPAAALPERIAEWIEDHPLFKTDAMFHSASIITNNELIQEGFSIEEDDFYDELNSRLSKRFPEAFGDSIEDSVESKDEDKKSSESDSEDVKDKEPQKARTVQQTVAGSSRSVANKTQPRKSKTVDLSREELAQAKRWGFDLDRISKRAAHIEDTKDVNGYAPIAIPKKK